MPESFETCVTVEEEVALNTIPGTTDADDDTCDQEISSSGKKMKSCCDDQHYRKLAICSIICGISCIGIKALINSVKAEKTTDRMEAKRLSQKARKFGIISIVTWVSVVVSIPLLMGLFSYLITFQD